MTGPTGRGTDGHPAVRRVVEAGRALAVAGQQDLVWGHVAVRDPDGRGAWIKRSGLGFDEVAAGDVQLLGWAGELLAGTGGTHIECHIHLQVMRARSDVVTSVHTHPPAVNAFTALDEPLAAISHEGVLFAGDRLPRSPLSGDLVADPDTGAALATALGRAPACLMPRHGLVAVGGTDAAAVMHAVLLDAACRLHLLAGAAGRIRSASDAEELRRKTAHVWPSSQLEAGYAHLLRRAARSG